ncbi:hypothetical protein C2S51_021532 [Perilla frutescens var. frutescens]|nr:hypothetical protein C2S51_021532 [Perilla frutescens var. frutescens]
MLRHKGTRFNHMKELDSALKKVLEVREEMKMSSGSSSSGPALTGMQTDDDLQQVELRLLEVMKEMMSSGSSSSGAAFTFVTPDLQEVTRELDSAMEQVEKLIAEHQISSTVSSSSVKIGEGVGCIRNGVSRVSYRDIPTGEPTILGCLLQIRRYTYGNINIVLSANLDCSAEKRRKMPWLIKIGQFCGFPGMPLLPELIMKKQREMLRAFPEENIERAK